MGRSSRSSSAWRRSWPRCSRPTVLKYWACPGEQRFAFDPKLPLDNVARRRRFRDDLLKLADAGFMHAYGMRGTLYWSVGSKTGTMMLENWFVLKPIEDKDEVVAILSGFV